MPQKNIYERHILVTGGAGFIGSHCLDYFVQRYPNYHFTCIDKLNYASENSTKFMRNVLDEPNFTFFRIDLSEDYEFLYDFLIRNFSKNKITNVLNIAAESSVDRSFNNAIFFQKNNVQITQNLLECVRILLQKHPELDREFQFVHISTDEVYGEQKDGTPVKEDAPLRPTNPYAASKACCDTLVQTYGYSFNIPYVIVRSNNVYGIRQYKEKIIPMTISKLLNYHLEENNKHTMLDKITIHGDGSNKRTFLHVDDFVSAIEFIWLKNFPSSKSFKDETSSYRIFNIGSEFEFQNLNLVKNIVNVFRKKINLKETELWENYIVFIKDRNFNDSRYAIDCSKIKSLGWRPQVKFEEGLSKILDEYLSLRKP